MHGGRKGNGMGKGVTSVSDRARTNFDFSLLNWSSSSGAKLNCAFLLSHVLPVSVVTQCSELPAKPPVKPENMPDVCPFVSSVSYPIRTMCFESCGFREIPMSLLH